MNRCPTMPVAPRIPTLYFFFKVSPLTTLVSIRINKAVSVLVTQRLQPMLHSADALSQHFQIRAERHPQKPFGLASECETRNRNDSFFKKSLRNLHRIAKFTDIYHCVEGPVRHNGSQLQFAR